MSDNDEIKPGDRFERVGPGAWGVNHGDVCTALRPAGNGYNGWFVRGSNTIMYLGNPALWRRLPRTDAPAVKVEAMSPDATIRHALQLLETGRIVGPHWWNAVDEPTAPAPRCKPICTPAAPCLTEGGCPAWREMRINRAMLGEANDGVSPDALPPVRASTYQPRCAELAGWSSWNGRARK